MLLGSILNTSRIARIVFVATIVEYIKRTYHSTLKLNEFGTRMLLNRRYNEDEVKLIVSIGNLEPPAMVAKEHGIAIDTVFDLFFGACDYIYEEATGCRELVTIL